MGLLRLVGQNAHTAARHQPLHLIEIAIDRADQVGMRLGIALVVALLKILLVATGLQHLDRELLVEVGDGASAVGNISGSVLGDSAHLVDRTEGDQTDEAEASDRHDLVGQTDGKAPHEGAPQRSRRNTDGRISAPEYCGDHACGAFPEG
ncbi:hypothetical protein ACFQZO_26940 [Bradyrhizobium sp. GCM10027634]|uniref:hypothetical protein n=1 Tax=unclassified Bradyrhizobium TaxID=2631580 RepID=UPI001FF04DF6|nr:MULTISPECIES: hypothetical protein [unclassified Bradyrhizobium]MDN5004486.1 hypothetical protein [Bradyrhizobium sp. WYCCWR 12677]